jgi:hypothetical protein
MDERELAGLLYRADWTRLALTGTVRGSGWMPNTTFTHRWRAWETGPRTHHFPLPDPPVWMTESVAEPPEAERALILAPGRRYRATSADSSRVVGCDGERAWQWYAELPAETDVRFDHRPEVPVPVLLAPVWLLLGYRLTIGEETTVAGRPGIAVTGVARLGPSLALAETTLVPWGLVPRPERVSVVIDAELGIVLRLESWSKSPDAEAAVTEFLSLAVGGAADPSVFTAPAGSFFGDGPRGDRASDRRPVDEAGRAALKLVGGLAAGGLGAAIRYTPRRQADPFAAATAEDPEDAMPVDDPLPDWVTDGAAADGPPVSDEVIDLLYRGGLDPVPFTADMHEWGDADVVVGSMLRAVPESARRAGFGGVGFLVDTILTDERDAGHIEHVVYRMRVGSAWDRYRVDLVHHGRPPSASAGRPRLRKPGHEALTTACDGERTFSVFADEVRVGPARVLDEGRYGDLGQLLDGSWLLAGRLSGGAAVEVDGRPAYLVIATAGAGPALPAPMTWMPAWWLPAVAVVDASSGRLLRVTRYRDGKAATRLELRSVADGGSDDFGFTPPEGLPVVEVPERPTEFSMSDGRPWSPPEDLRAAAEAVKGFFGSFLGGSGGDASGRR